ncbi:MAG: alpha/beta fold hydrolase [Chloracidobacterium sp.]|uniref:Alpha/beta fold hydrolase n=1 Tax=Chloracidobacterium validum TaxID=2821543 RepID=A0ABX8B509_9BACT|nr:alpha/beta fold hydrolase [Chloracidobacterium validum]QUW02062.1 alpha/beta fold hydrolase [Chloracidobacterium validum]
MTFLLDGPAGPLEALHSRASNPRGWAALVCHPHPVFGGTMHNRVVYRIAKAFLAAGADVLRFNFRGVGASRGGYDGGIGEQADAAAALAYLQKNYPHDPLVVAGFSFGSWVGFQAARNCPQVVGRLGVGVPVARFDFSFLPAVTLPTWVVQGDTDEFGPAAIVESLLSRCQEPKGLTLVPGANHFFDKHQTELATALAAAVAWLQGRCVQD